MLRKSFSSIISLYGILMSGAAYVPIDPLLPSNRIKYIMENCGIRQLITSAEYWDRITYPGELSTLESVVITDKEPASFQSQPKRSDGRTGRTPWDFPPSTDGKHFPIPIPRIYCIHPDRQDNQRRGYLALNSSFIKTAAEFSTSPARIDLRAMLSSFRPFHFRYIRLGLCGATLV
jgi:hypothetical protein